MRSLLVGIGLLVATPAIADVTAPAANAPYDFQGFAVGSLKTEWDAANPGAKCRAGDIAGETACPGPKPPFIRTFGGVTYHFYAPPGQEPRLSRIEILGSSADTANVLEGLTGKWGTPAEASAVIMRWKRPTSSIRYMSLVGGFAVTIADDALVTAYEAAKRARAATAF